MANVLNGNTFFIDTAHSSAVDDLDRKQVLVTGIVVTATGANGRIVLGDKASNSPPKLDLRVADSGTTQSFIFRDSIVLFPNGIQVITLTNAVATVIIKSPGA